MSELKTGNSKLLRRAVGGGMLALAIMSSAACGSTEPLYPDANPSVSITPDVLTRSDRLRAIKEELGTLAARDYVDNKPAWRLDTTSFSSGAGMTRTVHGANDGMAELSFVVETRPKNNELDSQKLVADISSVAVTVFPSGIRGEGTTFALLLDEAIDGWNGLETCVFESGSVRQPRFLALGQNSYNKDSVLISNAELEVAHGEAIEIAEQIIAGNLPAEAFSNC